MSISHGTPSNTREIVTIAVLSSLGGALSTFVGYLGNLINLALGVPFGAGQFMAGLHVFWIVLIRLLIPKNGAGTAAGLLKGVVELFTGSTHGIVIVLVSLVQGIIIDGGAALGGSPSRAGPGSKMVWWLAGSFSTASNVLVLQAIYFAGAPLHYIMLIVVLAFCSGFIFAGYFAWQALDFLYDTGLVLSSTQVQPSLPRAKSKRTVLYRNLPAVALFLFLGLGSTIYVIAVAKPFSDPYSCEVFGYVDSPYVFLPTAFVGQEVTIEAELIGAYVHLPRANYTGILLSTVLMRANPRPEASMLSVMGRDGYTVLFDLQAALIDTRLLLTETDEGLWLIAGDYDGSMWVKQVTAVKVL